jgi:uncharacterized protein (TIGR03118 family)
MTIRSGATNVIKVDNSASGAVYKGLALTNNPDYIYAANFSVGTIDVYDGTWTKAALAGSFKDPSVPEGFAPFNIQLLAGKLYVTYAQLYRFSSSEYIASLQYPGYTDVVDA